MRTRDPWRTIDAPTRGDSPGAWLRAHPEVLREALEHEGALLLRGFAGGEPAELASWLEAAGEVPCAYRSAMTPRTDLGHGVATATEFPAGKAVLLHNEGACTRRFPGRVWFHCREVDDLGASTSLADGRVLLDRLPDEVSAAFRTLRIRYLANFTAGPGFGLSWPRAFGVTDADQLEARCEAEGLGLEWTGPDTCRTTVTLPAVGRQPGSGLATWFNHVHAFHPASLDPEVRDLLRASYPPEQLPTWCCFEDGEEIPDAWIQTIVALGEQLSHPVVWEPDDLLVVDNLALQHGRDPFQGRRRLLAAMSSPLGWRDVEAAAPA